MRGDVARCAQKHRVTDDSSPRSDQQLKRRPAARNQRCIKKMGRRRSTGTISNSAVHDADAIIFVAEVARVTGKVSSVIASCQAAVLSVRRASQQPST